MSFPPVGIGGCLEWQREYPRPISRERCILHVDARLTAAELSTAYLDWARETEVDPSVARNSYNESKARQSKGQVWARPPYRQILAALRSWIDVRCFREGCGVLPSADYT